MAKLIREKLMENLRREAAGRVVTDARLGLGYCAVQLDDLSTGAAYTFRDNLPGGCSVFTGKRPLAGSGARDILAFAASDNRLEAAVGLAAANALGNKAGPDRTEGDVLDFLSLEPGDRVGMVGFFSPLIKEMEEKGAELLIFEENPRPGVIGSGRDALKMLPQCQVALITSTTLINHTVDQLLEAAGSCREVVLLGPSTPLCREIFESTPVTLLSGIVVERPSDFLRVVSEGGGTRMFKGLVSKVNLRLK
ncbi:MAG: DUF364 domain-containing protein [Pseudomonadota bacterium]